MSSLSYRPEIDGLRALAVLPVLVYHARIPFGDGFLLPGGYLGVDVFFVISGYLITRLIWKERAKQGHFSLSRFYERRARRLLPVLLLVMLCTLPFAWRWLMPAELVETAKSIIATQFFVSNFFWWLTPGRYGDGGTLLKPFLHTWSLAVEEQFYLIFPLLLLTFIRWAKPWVLPLMLGAVLVGFLGTDWIATERSKAAFYLLPTRAWELLAGASLGIAQQRNGSAIFRLSTPKIRARVAGALSLLGLVMISASYSLVPLAKGHPGWPALPVILGSVLIIANGDIKSPVNRILSCRPLMITGLLSYSLYLWHYPVFAFARIELGTPGLLVWAMLFMVTFALSVTGYLLVEKPARDRARLSFRTFTVATAASMITLLLVSSYAIHGEGLRGRFNELQSLYGINEFDNAVLLERIWWVLSPDEPRDDHFKMEAHRPSAHERNDLSFSDNPISNKVLIIGNSHAVDLFNALYLNRDRFKGIEFARYALANHHPKTLRRLLATPNFNAADTIILSTRYDMARETKLAALPALIRTIKEKGKQLVITSNSEEFMNIAGLPVFDWVIQRGNGDGRPAYLGPLYFSRRNPAVIDLNLRLETIARENGAGWLNKTDYQCDLPAKTCHGLTPEGYKLFFDYGHYTIEGSAFFGQRIAESGWLNDRITTNP